MAAAILGNPDAVEIVAVEWFDNWSFLQSGDIDLSMDGVTVTMSRDAYGVSNVVPVQERNLLYPALTNNVTHLPFSSLHHDFI